MPIESIERTILLKRCEEASTFHDFHTLHLIPQDFHIIASSGDNKTIAEIFQCLETILGYAYVSASSYINDDQLVFYFDPGKANRLDINNCRYSKCITEIFLWAFSNDNALERISIARNVLRLSWLSFIIAMTTILHSFSSKSLWAVFQEELQFFRKILFP